MRFHNIPIKDIMSEAIRYGGIIIDIRPERDFLQGHIPLAINVPLQYIQDGRHNLPKNKTLILYCEHGGASALACRILIKEGYRAINTVGGISQYTGALTKTR